jgi:TolB protein
VDTNPTWSPDGKQIAFVSDRNGKPQIYVMNSDGSNQRLLPLPGTYNTSPDWSPDGGKIAYQSRGDKAYFSIWVYDVSTGEASPITKGPWNDESPSWSPDGRKLVFTSTRDKKQRLYLMNRDGSGVRPLFKGKSSDKSEDFTPAWERFW